MPELEFNYIGDGILANHDILLVVVGLAGGLPVRIAPFRDEFIAKFGVWIKGDAGTVAALKEAIDGELARRKIPFTVDEYKRSGKRG